MVHLVTIRGGDFIPRKPIWTDPIQDEKAEDEKINHSTGNVRVNLSIPRGLHEELEKYTEENCLPSIPSAVVQLVRLQLRAQNKRKAAIDIFLRPAKEVKKLKPDVIEALQDMIVEPDLPSE